MRTEVFYDGVGKYVHDNKILSVMDDKGNLIMDVVKVEERFVLPRFE